MRERLHKLHGHARDLLRFHIWDQDLSSMPRLHAFVFRQLRVAVIFVRGFGQGRIQLRASVLTFTTLLTLVPVLVLAITIAEAFGALGGLQSRLESFLVEYLSPGGLEGVRAWLIQFFESVHSGGFRGLSMLVLIGGVIGLFGSIEHSFNDIWGVHRGRSIFQRVSTYTTLMVFGPILIVLSLSLTASFETSSLRAWIESLSPAFGILTTAGFKLLPIFLTGLAFTLVYTVVPNVHVSLRASLPAGIVAGILWELSKMAFGLYITNATHYVTLYSSLAAIPLFLIWVYVSWLVVLFGAQLAFARDAAHDFRLEEVALDASFRERFRAAVHIALAAARSYNSGSPPPDLVDLARRLRLPLRLVHSVAEDLLDGRILHQIATRRRTKALIPARDPARITVLDVASCMVNKGTPLSYPPQAMGGPSIVDLLMIDMEGGFRERWGALGLNDLLDQQEQHRGQEILPFSTGDVARFDRRDAEGTP